MLTRDSCIAICQPRALYVYTSSNVLRTVPYFNDRKLLQFFQGVTQ